MLKLIVEKEAGFNYILEQIHQEFLANPSLRDQIPFTLKPKGQGEATRYQSLLDYTGPDKKTEALLEESSKFWTKNPQAFWDGATGPDISSRRPEAQMVARYLQLDRRGV